MKATNILNYKTYGDANNSNLIVIHGLFGSLDNWQSHATKWSSMMHVITIDLRNHGRSFHSIECDLNVLSEDIFNLLNHLNIKACTILGHSLGGKVAMQFSVNYPDFNLQNIIIVDIAPRKYFTGHQLIFDSLFKINLSTLSKRTEAEALLNDTIKDTSTIQFLLKNLYRKDDEVGYEWRFNLSSLYQNYESLVDDIYFTKKIEIPTLLIKGAQSDYVSQEDEVRFNEYFNKLIIATVPDSGHWVHADNPLVFNAIVLNFIVDN